MQKNKLTEKDKKYLAYFQSTQGKIYYRLVALSPLFLLVMGTLNLWSAVTIGRYSESSLLDIARTFFHGYEKDQLYEGVFLLALERFETSLFLYFFTVIILLYFLKQIKNMRRRNSIIINTLKQIGEW